VGTPGDSKQPDSVESEGGLEKWIEVQESPVHGLGVFARRRLKKGQRIGRFEGDRTLEDGTYVLWIFDDEGEEIGIEGRNALRFLNHNSKPNAEFEDADLYVMRSVAPGAEVLIDYGPEWAESDPS
jgi:SET domain-containing protein